MYLSLKTHVKKIDYYAFLLLIFTLPFYREISAITYSLWVLCCLVKLFVFNEKDNIVLFKGTENKKIFLLLFLYYFLLIISLLWSEDIAKGIQKLETKLALIITPLLFLKISSYLKSKQKYIFDTFIGGVIIASILCLLIAFIGVIKINALELLAVIKRPNEVFNIGVGFGEQFFYSNFSHFLHPTYFAMMISLSILLLRFKRLKATSKYENWFFFAGILFLLFILYLLSSKAGIFLTFLILFTDIIIYNLKSKNYIRLFGRLLFYAILLYLILVNNYRKPLEDISHNISIAETQDSTIHNKTITSRIISWKVATKIILRNPLIGVGIGDTHIVVKKECKNDEFASTEKRRLNAHNQFIEDALRIGVIGGMVLLFIFIIPFISSIKQGKYLTAYFLIIIGANALFESILEKQTGVMFFSVFYCFFVFIYRPR